jgi:hypothetical protein
MHRPRPERWRQNKWLLHHDNAPSHTSHFDAIEVMEAESQAVLNTLTEQDFQDAFKKWQKRWERRIRAEGGYFKGDGGQ